MLQHITQLNNNKQNFRSRFTSNITSVIKLDILAINKKKRNIKKSQDSAIITDS